MSEPLIEKFRTRAIERGGLLFFAPQDAIELIEMIEKGGQLVLGIDGFFLTEETTQPSVENSLDFSADVTRGINMNQRALQFIRERRHSGLHFEITCY